MLTRSALILLGLIFFGQFGYSQCPGATECNSAATICLLNGFSCNTTDVSNSSFPVPSLCFGAGLPQNIRWWAFVGTGKPLSITISTNLASCSKQQGVQAGVFEGDCSGANVWDCNASCSASTFTLTGGTTSCGLYFLWVDGCQKDVCPYTISFSGSGGTPPNLPSIPNLTTRNNVCVCGEFEVCVPDLGDCYPFYQWHINGVPRGQDDCISVPVSEAAQEGDMISVCLTVSIGNPGNPGSLCDQKTKCTDFFVEGIQQIIEPCETVCFEDQPVDWHGFLVLSSCIVPPCSTRIIGSSGCCEDVYKAFTFLPQPIVGFKDTFLCGMEGILEPDGKIYRGEPCYELIEFKKSVINSSCPTSIQQCDTSYELVVGRFNFEHRWTSFCEPLKNAFYINPNVEYDTDCPYFLGSVAITLEWYDKATGKIIDTTSGGAYKLIKTPGTYCVNVWGNYQGLRCLSPRTICYDVTPEMLHQTAIIEGDARVCFDSTTEFSFQPDTTILEYNWIIKGQGRFIGPKDTSAIVVQWDSLEMDTSQICLDIKTECSEYQLCKQIFICPKTTSTIDHPLGEIYYSFPTQQLFWKGLNSSSNNNWLSVYNIQGQALLKKSIPNNGYMNLDYLPKGIYLIQVNNGERSNGMTVKVNR